MNDTYYIILVTVAVTLVFAAGLAVDMWLDDRI